VLLLLLAGGLVLCLKACQLLRLLGLQAQGAVVAKDEQVACLVLDKVLELWCAWLHTQGVCLCIMRIQQVDLQWGDAAAGQGCSTQHFGWWYRIA
jgi:hypothetical protein